MFDIRLPALPHPSTPTEITADYLTQLREHQFSGDIHDGYAERLIMATDNSIYQFMPQAVLYPKCQDDIVTMLTLASQPKFSAISLTARGGGTGTNGQSLNTGIIVDLSRYMTRIIELNLDEGWVRVEAGVVKDKLNHYLKPHGYFFAPELSTSNRATIGGMLSTDASGQGSLVYGKTSDHIIGLTAVLSEGDVIETEPITRSTAEALAANDNHIGRIYRQVLQTCFNKRQLIEEKYPKVTRFLTGYDLKHVCSDDLSMINLSRIITGAEGTLAMVTEAKLNITPIPKHRVLVTIKYDSFDAALRHAPELVLAKALSVETIDSNVFALAQQDIIWHSVAPLIRHVEGKVMRGINIVEFAGNSLATITHDVKALCKQLDKAVASEKEGVIGYQWCDNLSDINKIYAMRKKAVGLLGNVAGDAKPVPFVEDTCVPPHALADYITDFRALLDSYGLSYGMFGHVDTGVLHVRPALDMTDPHDEQLVSTITERIVELTLNYGGLLWGEHGKGVRGAYGEAYFGSELFTELRLIKTAFDAENRFNPGKICTPITSDAELYPITSPTRGARDRTIPVTTRHHYRGPLSCNGNGLCFNFDEKSPMCPSMKVSGNRLYSPKGRAMLLREWLRLLHKEGVDPLKLEANLQQSTGTLRGIIETSVNFGVRYYNQLAHKNRSDFSHEVKEAMATCLACKACSTQCPIKIDIPEFRAKFYQLYHARYPRPVRDYLIADIEHRLPLLAKQPQMINKILSWPLTDWVLEKGFGLVNTPKLAVPTLQSLIQQHGIGQPTIAQLQSLPSKQRANYVLIVQDAFTTYYQAPLVIDFIRLCEKLGYTAVLLPFVPSGKAQHIKGFLRRYQHSAERMTQHLQQAAKTELPLIGIDPAVVLSLRDELQKITRNSLDIPRVQLPQEWLLSVIRQREAVQCDTEKRYYLLGHCTEKTQQPESTQQWQAIFQHVGATLEELPVGCCGMAGIFGHERQNRQVSTALYQLTWQEAIERHGSKRCLTTGYSCRSQVKYQDDVTLLHPLQQLVMLLN